VQVGVIRSSSSGRGKLIVTVNAEVAIRSFREADRFQLQQLWDEVFPDDAPRNAPDRMIDGSLRARPESLLIAEIDGVVVGAVIAAFDGVRGWIYHLAVSPAHRRRGIATRLMRGAEATLRALGCPKINLQVRSTNQSVVAFYRAFGYQLEDRISLGRLLD
jgi:ribosomal protein S18 acetylase RimI-like enzyme